MGALRGIDELSDPRANVFRIVPKKKVPATRHDFEPRARDALREHLGVRDRNQWIFVTVDDQGFVGDAGEEGPTRPSRAAEQLHGVTVRRGIVLLWSASLA